MLLIKQKRIEEGISQKSLAEHLKISANRLCQYENGKREPNIYIILKISRFLNCKMEDLVKEDIYEQ